MQYGTRKEQALDILDNVIAVLAGLRERQGVPVGDLIGNLGTAQSLIDELLEPDVRATSQGSIGRINPERDRHNSPHRKDTHETTGRLVRAYDPECAECARVGFCTWCQGPCQLPTPMPDLS
jgi:hypothetical protein